MNLNKENMRKLRELILFTIIILIALWNYLLIFQAIRFVFGIVFPFLLGGAIAFVLNVPMNFLEEKLFRNRFVRDKKPFRKLARPMSLILTLIIVIGVVVLVMFVVIPELGKTLISLGRTIRLFVPEAQRFLEELFTDNSEIQNWLNGLNLDPERMIDSAMSFFQNGAGNVLNSTVSAISSIVSGVTTFVIAFVFSCYILLQKENLGRQFRRLFYALLPEKHVDWFLRVCSLTSASFNSFLSGQCLEAFILAAMFFVSMSLLNMPYALVIAVLIGVTALIPIFGAFIGCFVGVFLILIASPIKALWFLVLFLVLQQVEGNVIYPRVVGGSVGLPSIWVLVAVTLGASLGGVLGILFAIPVVSVVYTLLREHVRRCIHERGIAEEKIK